jgi:hypothetical protein
MGRQNGSVFRAFLNEPMRPAQVSAVSQSGLPLLGSLWFLFEDGRFWFNSLSGTLLLRAASGGTAVAVLVDDFDPPTRIMPVRVRGEGSTNLPTPNGLLASTVVTSVNPLPRGHCRSQSASLIRHGPYGVSCLIAGWPWTPRVLSTNKKCDGRTWRLPALIGRPAGRSLPSPADGDRPSDVIAGCR